MIRLLKKSAGSQSGAVLVVTLAVVSVLITAALYFASAAGRSAMATRHLKDTFIARQKALAGLALGRMILVEDASDSETDSVQEPWADPEILRQAVDALGYKKDTLILKIEDELGKIQVNALITGYPGHQIAIPQWEVLERFFRLTLKKGSANGSADPLVIMNGLKDWLDSMDDDAVTGLSGAETDVYQDLVPPYRCANGPVKSMGELLLINGTAGLDPGSLAGSLTVYGLSRNRPGKNQYRYSGRINVNTASQDVLAALLPEGLEELALELVEYRSRRQENLKTFTNRLDKGWVEKVIDLSEKEKNRLNRLTAFSSDTFKITCSAVENSAQVSLTAYIKRLKLADSGKWTCRILQMEQNPQHGQTTFHLQD